MQSIKGARRMKNNSLESLRGIAALGTALYHSVFLAAPRGNILMNAELFVDFFFVLSGFVLTMAYAQKVSQGMSFRVFAFLRLARLMPLHAFAMATWVVWAALAPGAFEGETHTLSRFVLNLSLLNAVGLMPVLSWNYPAWSIGAELVAYTAFWLVYARFGGRMNWVWALVISVAAYAVVLANGDTILRTNDFGGIRCIGGFFLGVAMYYLSAQIRVSKANSTAFEVLVVVGAIALLSMSPGAVWLELATVVSFAAVVFVFSGSSGAVTGVLNAPVLVFLGRISYSVYLLHALAFEIMFHQVWSGPVVLDYGANGGGRYFYATALAPILDAAVLGFVVLCAYGTWRWIEEPARKWSKQRVQHVSVTSQTPPTPGKEPDTA